MRRFSGAGRTVSKTTVSETPTSLRRLVQRGQSLGRFSLGFVDSVLERRRDIPEFRLHELDDISCSHNLCPNFLVEFVHLRDVCQETIVGEHIRMLLT